MSKTLTDGQRRYLARIGAWRKSPEGLRARIDNAMEACDDGAPRSQIRHLLAQIRDDLPDPEPNL